MKAVIFDLDGTLLDTIEDLADSVNLILQEAGFPTHEVEAYKLFVGEGMQKLIENALPEEKHTPETILKLSQRMTEIYAERWHNKTHLYTGVPDMLAKLSQHQIPINILSNKPNDFTRLCVKYFLPKQNFQIVRGALPDIPRKPHPQAALEICESLNFKPQEVGFIGDSSIDMKTAKAAGMIAIGASWGFRSRQELIENGADKIITQPSEIPSLFGLN